MCNAFTDRQVNDWLDELNQVQRRDERILFGAATATWIFAFACYVGVAYFGFMSKVAATAACATIGALIGGWGVAIFKKAGRLRRQRRYRNRQVDERRRQAPQPPTTV